MKLKLFQTLILVFFCLGIHGQTNLTCTPEMVESYGVISNGQARKERLMMCPQIEFSCCPAYEQFKMYQTFNKQVKPSFILLNEIIKKSLVLLQTEVITLMSSGKIDKDILAVADAGVKMRIQYAWEKIKGLRPKVIFQKAIKYQAVSGSYVAAWKSAFYCTVCDFANQSFIDLKAQTITYSAASCDALVQNTLLYTNLLNSVIVPYLATLSEIIWRLGARKGGQKLHGHRQVRKAISECADDFKLYDSGLANCKAYCEYFNLAQDSFILEGYPEFFANILVDIRTYATLTKAVLPAAPATPAVTTRRLIEDSVKNLLKKSRERNLKVLNAQQGNGYFKVNLPKSAIFKGFNSVRLLREDKRFNELLVAQKTQKRLESRRVLADAIDWTFDPLDPRNNNTVTIDIFERSSVDFNFDEADIGKMVEIQEIMNTGDPATQKMMIAFYFVNNFQAEMDDINLNLVFKETTQTRINYAMFKSKVSFTGINMHLIVGQMPWNVPYKEIGLSLTSSGSGQTEMVYPDVIFAVNTVSNQDILFYHEDQYITFRTPHFLMYDETMNQLIKDFAIKKVQLIIAQNMAVYNYLIGNFGQSQADSMWADLELLREQLTGLTVSPSQVQVITFNYTDTSNVTHLGMNITGLVNASGFANITYILDANQMDGSYSTDTQIVNMAQYNTYIQNNLVTGTSTTGTGATGTNTTGSSTYGTSTSGTSTSGTTTPGTAARKRKMRKLQKVIKRKVKK